MGACAAILITTIVGMTVTLALDRRARGPQLLGLGFLYGTGVVYFVELALPRWNAVSVTAILIAIAIGCAVTRLRGFAAQIPPATSQPRNRVTLLDVLTLIIIAAYIAQFTIAPLPEMDFWAIWGVKARVFFEHGGIDWHFLAGRWNGFEHPDYPPLLPLNYAYAAMMNGGWNDAQLGLVGAAFGTALLLVVRGITARETSPLASAAITLACAPFALAIPAGIGESPMIAFAGAGLLLLRDDDNRHAPLLLGLAACSKNEGIALLVIAVLANPRRALRLWPAALLAAPWMLIRTFAHMQTDLVKGSFAGRVAARLPYLGGIAADLARALADRWIWILIVLALLIATRDALRRQHIVFIIVAAQIAVYVIVYLGSPYDFHWSIEGSWARLTRQMLVPALAAAMLALAQTMRRREDAPHAEARSDF